MLSREMLELAHRYSGKIKEYVICTDDYWKQLPVDIVRLKVQQMLVDMLLEGKRINPPLRRRVRIRRQRRG